MKFLFISPNGDTVGIAYRVQQEGNEVRFFIPPQKFLENPDTRKADGDTGDGLVNKVKSWEPHVGWADVILIDAKGQSNGLETGKIADSLRKRGKMVIGAGERGERLELDRHFGQSILKAHGSKTIPTIEFKDFGKAQEFLRKSPGRYVIKPNADIESEFTVVGKEENGSDLLDELERMKKVWPKGVKVDFELQMFKDGVEIDVGGFFNGKDWLDPLWVQFEHKKVAAGDAHNPRGMGFMTGEAGSTHFWYPSPKATCRYFTETIARVRPWLEKVGFHGWCDINAIVDEDGVWPLEWTIRMGLPESYVIGEAFEEPYSSVLYKTASGKGSSFKAYPGWASVVRMMAMGFPFPDEVVKNSSGHRIKGLKPQDVEHFWAEDAKINEMGELTVSGASGVPFSITQKAGTLEESLQGVYSIIGPMSDTNLWYRPDIGSKCLEDLKKLKSLGYDFLWPESRGG